MPKFLVQDEIRFNRAWIVDAANEDAATDRVESGNWDGLYFSEVQQDADSGYDVTKVAAKAVPKLVEGGGMKLIEPPAPESALCRRHLQAIRELHKAATESWFGDALSAGEKDSRNHGPDEIAAIEGNLATVKEAIGIMEKDGLGFIPDAVSGLSDAAALDLVRESVYMKGEKIGDRHRFVVAMVVPYGIGDEVNDKFRAIEAFRELLSDDDWAERNLQVYDATTGKVETVAYEEMEEEECECGRKMSECQTADGEEEHGDR